jgi:subtilisin family serine protease
MSDRYLFADETVRRLRARRGSMILKIAPGEAHDRIPTALDVRAGAQEPATRLAIGSVDRIMRGIADGVRIARVHTAHASLGRLGEGHTHYDDVEHAVGLSRTFRVDLARAERVGDLIDAMRQLSVVEHAMHDYLCMLPIDESLAAMSEGAYDDERAWSSRTQVHATEALAYEPGDRAIVVAVIDTGVRYDHPELFGRLRAGFDTVRLGAGSLGAGMTLVGDTRGIDTDPEDEVGHGTACAAIIGAEGLQLPPGLAGDCSVLPIRVLGAAQQQGRTRRVGIGAISDIDDGVKRAIDLGAKVLNMSFGTPCASLDSADPTPHEDMVRYGLARGCIMVAASGNSGRTEQDSPAALDGVIAAGAVDADGRPTSFTTRGEHVALCAPGDRIITAGMEGVAAQTGTSFAAPFVAAAAALLVSRAERRSHPLTAADVRRILVASARPFAKGDEKGCGSGILDVHAALLALDREIDAEEPIDSDDVVNARDEELVPSH